MGGLRFLLALSVVIAHSGNFLGLSLGDGRMAVQAFYMVSGFYMSLVWTEKYSKLPNPIRTFYISRFLRIYPLYILVVLITVILAVSLWKTKAAFPLLNPIDSPLGWGDLLWVYGTQLTLIGLETPIFNGLHGYWISPVAWSLSLELMFYLLVPFLIPKPKLALAVLVGALFARYLGIQWLGGIGTPDYIGKFSYRFFPFEIALFLAGAFSYRVFSQTPDKVKELIAKQEVYFLAVLGVVGYLFYFQLIRPHLGERALWLYYPIVFVGIAILFQHTKTSKRDSYIGELSYPIYISHIPYPYLVGCGQFLRTRQSYLRRHSFDSVGIYAAQSFAAVYRRLSPRLA